MVSWLVQLVMDREGGHDFCLHTVRTPSAILQVCGILKSQSLPKIGLTSEHVHADINIAPFPFQCRQHTSCCPKRKKLHTRNIFEAEKESRDRAFSEHRPRQTVCVLNIWLKTFDSFCDDKISANTSALCRNLAIFGWNYMHVSQWHRNVTWKKVLLPKSQLPPKRHDHTHTSTPTRAHPHDHTHTATPTRAHPHDFTHTTTPTRTFHFNNFTHIFRPCLQKCSDHKIGQCNLCFKVSRTHWTCTCDGCGFDWLSRCGLWYLLSCVISYLPAANRGCNHRVIVTVITPQGPVHHPPDKTMRRPLSK